MMLLVSNLTSLIDLDASAARAARKTLRTLIFDATVATVLTPSG